MMWIPRIIFVAMVMFSVVFFVSGYVKLNFDTFDTEADIFTYRLLYGQGGLSGIDHDTQRQDLGVLKENELSQIFDKSSSTLYYGTENSEIAALVSIKTADGKKSLGPYYYNKELYDKKSPIAQTVGGYKGPGGVRMQERTLYVLLQNTNGERQPAYINISVLIPNS